MAPATMWKRITACTASVVFSLCAGMAAADDIEIYAGASDSSATYLPNVMFVIDTSGSMDGKDGTSTTRLYKVQEALKEVLAASTDVNVGLMRFSDPGGPVLFPVSHIDSAVSPDERVSVRLDQNDGSETNSGYVVLDNTVISLGNGDLHGFRFEDVRIPQGASIHSAQLYFGASTDSADAVTFTIKGEDADNSEQFSTASNDLSSRTFTSETSSITDASVWSQDQFSPSFDVTSIVEEITERSGWCGGQALSLFVKAENGSSYGARPIHANDSSSSLAAALKISYDYSNASGCVSGSHANQISAQENNVEETTNGWNSTGNVINVKSNENQAIGLRFENVSVPQGATIEEAYLTLTPYANQSNSSTSKISIEDTTNAAAYSNSRYPVTSRDFLGNVSWTVNGWWTNSAQNTSNISSLITSVVSKSGWKSGNAMSFKITPSNKEIKAYTYKGSASKAVSLYIKYRGTAESSSFTVRQHMQTLVDGLTHEGYTPVAETMYEAYRYFNSKDVEYGLVRGTDSKVKPLTRVSHENSYSGAEPVRAAGCSEDNLSASACSSEYIPSSPKPKYVSPVTHVCQQNHLVLLTDGYANKTRQHVRDSIDALTGKTCDAKTSGNINDVNCGVHLAQYNAASEKPNGAEDARIFTHTISFVPEGTGTPSWLTYLQDMATLGGGDFYPTSDATSVAEAFQRIISDAKKRNTTFVAPSVAISDVNKLLHDNFVYYAVFSPRDTQDWPGNLKKYKVQDGLILGKSGNNAVDPATGFFESAEGDYWSTTSSGNDEVSVGGATEVNANLTNRVVYSNLDGFKQISSSAHQSLVTEDVLGISARSDASDRRDELLNWIKGLDDDGNADYTMGDPLHSSPVVMNNDKGNDVIFFGTNQGFIHAIDTSNGKELYSFIPEELLSNVNEYYENSVFVNRVYGMDGPLTLYDSGDKKILVAGMRRGGESYYALDVTSSTPSMAWLNPIQPQSTGPYSKLGQSWSKMIPAKVQINDVDKNVLVFGGGYDPTQDTKETRVTDGVGNVIYMVDAATGELLWYASNANLSGGSEYTTVAGMDYAIPGDIYVLDRDRDGYSDHMYAMDMGGQVLRFDIHNGHGSTHFVSGGIIADVAGSSVEANNRRFFYTPDVGYADDAFGKYFAVALGSGYRAHPLNTEINDRFYVLRDAGVFETTTATVNGKNKVTYAFNKVAEDDLLDSTNITSGSDVNGLSTAELDRYKKGFYVRLTTEGEKVLSSPVIADYKVAFTTYIPGDSATAPNACTPPEGNGRAYVMSLSYGLPTGDYDENDSVDADDRYINLTHGGIPSSPKIIYSEQDLPVICVSSECANASTMFDSDGNPDSSTNSQGNSSNALNTFLPPTNRVYRDSNWSSEKEISP
ncbi:VWA domain-containing protein [Echinimonas agarilytica]|uniref:PilC/PilY family type IV pilus protein n=1 Tax=Echinimonas agarilytica TaxID=1215918 RepID=A0AA41W7I4_9GAMM|nr:VWA domain-containing protein [Echinimonas agarilytica]MCM2680610.1 PilC/PilY family type IV pilus protein [Echinimonas agarilytica]